MTTYYISGPMRGKPRYNQDQFNEVETALISWCFDKGHKDGADQIINPSRNFEGDTSSHDPNTYLTLDFKQVLESDVIVQIPGWQSSEGAAREANLGVWTGKRFMVAVPTGEVHGTTLWEFPEVDSPMFSESIRAQACDVGKSLITGDRNNDYGPPWQDFQRTSDALTAYGYRHTMLPSRAPACPTCGAKPLESHDTAILIDCVKTSRIMWSPAKVDHWHDKIGYSACGLECALHDEDVRKGRA